MFRMIVTRENGAVVKRPGGVADGTRIEREAELLIEARHAGVVALLDSGRDERGPWLRLEDAGGQTVASIVAADEFDESLFAIVASVATTIADLHEIGIVHGAIEADHVLVDGAGRPLLCSFGRGGHVGARDPQLDVAALGRLIEATIGDRLSPAQVGVVDMARGVDPVRHRVTARQLAAALTSDIGGRGGWPGNSTRVLRPRLGDDAGRGWWARQPVVVAAALASVVVVVVVVFVQSLGPKPHPQKSGDRGPVAASAHDGVQYTYEGGVLVFAGQRFALGEAGDQVAVGRWFCGDPKVALLRSDGSIYVFDHLATSGLDQEGRLVARAPGASWLHSQPDSRLGCDLLVVGDRQGSAVVRPVAA